MSCQTKSVAYVGGLGPSFFASLRQVIILWLLLFLSWAGSAFAGAANQSGLVDLNQIKSAASVSSDVASAIFDNLFGPVFASPFSTAGGATTLFGVIFLAFNVVVFSAGVVWATYGVLAGVVQSAHEGVVLGKRMSAIWMPIRMVTGIGSLVPAFGGFSLSQVIMIYAAGWGIVFGNYAYLQALTAASNFTPLVNLNVPHGTQTKSVEELARAIFEQELCVQDAIESQNQYRAAGNSVPANELMNKHPAVFFKAAGTNKAVGSAWGTNLDPGRCGVVGIRYVGDGTRSAQSFWGFRNANVDYNAISQGVYDRYANAYSAFDTNVRTQAILFTFAVKSASANREAPVALIPEAEIIAAANTYKVAAMGAGSQIQSNGPALKESAIANMKQYGFLGAGAFYSTLAELNSSIGQATQAVNFVIEKGSYFSAYSDANSSEDRSRFRSAYVSQMAKQMSTDSTFAAPPGGSCVASNSSVMEILSGKCSWGQTFVDYMLRGATAGSSVGGQGSSNAFRIIDPIIAAKNVGDYMMTTGAAIFGVIKYLEPDVSNGGAAGESSNKSSVFSKIKDLPIVGGIFKLGGAILAMLPLIAGLMFGLGALLSIYIPMVPFINWVSAMVQYLSTVVEAMAAAPLWSFAHLQPDGEGMGQRTERGYIYLLLMLFTPILMVVGFFSACGLIILSGSAVLWLFMPAMANVQGNSVTGIFSAIGFIFIFFLLMNILIQGLFNLIMDLKDDVIGWIGNVGRSQIGRDTESKASNLFVMGGRIGQHAAQDALKPKPIKPKGVQS